MFHHFSSAFILFCMKVPNKFLSSIWAQACLEGTSAPVKAEGSGKRVISMGDFVKQYMKLFHLK